MDPGVRGCIWGLRKRELIFKKGADTVRIACQNLPFLSLAKEPCLCQPSDSFFSEPSSPTLRPHSTRLHLIPASFCCVLGLMSSSSS